MQWWPWWPWWHWWLWWPWWLFCRSVPPEFLRSFFVLAQPCPLLFEEVFIFPSFLHSQKMKHTMKWFEDQDKQEMPAEFRIHWALYLAVGRFSSMIGLSQWQFDKERRTIKFKLCSLATVFSLLRLVFFSFPFILLPAFLFVIFKDEELESFAGWSTSTWPLPPSARRGRAFSQPLTQFSSSGLSCAHVEGDDPHFSLHQVHWGLGRGEFFDKIDVSMYAMDLLIVGGGKTRA